MKHPHLFLHSVPSTSLKWSIVEKLRSRSDKLLQLQNTKIQNYKKTKIQKIRKYKIKTQKNTKRAQNVVEKLRSGSDKLLQLVHQLPNFTHRLCIYFFSHVQPKNTKKTKVDAKSCGPVKLLPDIFAHFWNGILLHLMLYNYGHG